ncbi:hypothetical protein D3C71_1622660 [compost metagenome]
MTDRNNANVTGATNAARLTQGSRISSTASATLITSGVLSILANVCKRLTPSGDNVPTNALSRRTRNC